MPSTTQAQPRRRFGPLRIIVAVLMATLAFSVAPAVSLTPATPAYALGGIGSQTGCDAAPPQSTNWVMYIPDRILFPVVEVAVCWYLEQLQEVEPNIGGVAFGSNYAIALKMGGLLLFPVLFLATINAVLRGGMREIVRTWTIGLPVAILAGVGAIAFVELMLRIDTELCRPFKDMVLKDIQAYLLPDLFAYLDAASFEMGVVLSAVSLMFIAMSIALYLEFIFRAIVISLGLLFLPLALAAWVWSSVRKWAITSMEVVITAVFSKFITLAILTFGFHFFEYSLSSAMFHPGQVDYLGQLLSAVVVMFLACVSGPALLAWVLAPSHRIASRRDFTARQNISQGRIYQYQTLSRMVRPKKPS